MPWQTTPLKDREERLRNGMATRLGLTTTPGRASNIGALSAEVAAEVDDVHTHVAWQARQMHVATADEDTLPGLARTWGVLRKPAVAARGVVAFTGTDGVTIPLAAVVRHADGREYKIDTGETVVAGLVASVVDGVATMPVTAMAPGTAGNLAPGSALSLINPVAGVSTTATVTVDVTGGTDLEDLETFRRRVLFRQQFPPQGGHLADYIIWATEVPGVSAAWVAEREMGLGTVTVRIAAEDALGGPVPSEALRQTVEDHIEGHINPVTSQWTGRPGGMEVFVVAPVAKVINPVFEELSPTSAATLAAIETSLKEMLRRRAAPGATIRLDWLNEAVSTAIGEDYHRLASPAADVICTINELATVGVITPPEN